MLVSNTFYSNPALLLPLLSAIVGLIILFSLSVGYRSSAPADLFLSPPREALREKPNWITGSSRPAHPIDDLVRAAQDQHEQLLHQKSSTDTLSKAAAAYREKRQRHPPPGFDKWYEYATSKNAFIVEGLFDQIYQDLEPFWALEPAAIREETLKWPFMFTIRNGKAQKRGARFVSGEWMQYWLRMFAEIESFLPDVDMAINAVDESRVMVPWEDMNNHMQKAAESRSLDVPTDRSTIVTKYPKLAGLSFKGEDIGLKGLKLPDGNGPWNQEIPFWNLTQAACPPGSLARNTKQDTNFISPPVFQKGFPNGTHHGYISNWTDSRNVCTHPQLANLYGLFVNPRFNSVNQTLVPLFSGCKVQNINNEILLPAAKYFSDEVDFDFAGEDIPWNAKSDSIIWRGQATGGAHKKENWKRFHRHRFIAMLNGSLVTREERSQDKRLELNKALAEDGNQPQDPKKGLTAQNLNEKDPPPHNFPVPGTPNDNPWDLNALKTNPTSLGDWIGPKADAGFDHLMCAPWVWSVLGNGKRCGYMDAYYKAQDRVTMSEQFGYKYVPDIDGNSYSGRYRAFLRSSSLPIKSTIWSEWHDARLIPWKHFVPMDNTFVDFWGIMEYFLGYGWGDGESDNPKLRKPHHDDVAETIARNGQEWAAQVLRKEDMVIYAYRLILEYKRVTSDDRARMMFVDDL